MSLATDIKKEAKKAKNVSKTKIKKKYSNEFLLKLLEDMIYVRRVEEKAGQQYGLRKIGGFCHLYIGQEAIAAGAFAATNRATDYMYTTYRDHAHALLSGMDAGVMMAELFGKVTGCSKGKGGSMHLMDLDKKFMGGHGIVGAHIPLATGTAFRIAYKKEKGVVLVFFGDGAIHNGNFHEAVNLAAIWHLPIVYICENNQYGMGTDFRRVSSVEDLTDKAKSYGIPGKQVNGMCAVSVYEDVKKAVNYAQENQAPTFLEIKTYRYVGHSMSDPATYRSKEEVAEHKENDPISILKNDMIKEGVISEAAYKVLDQKWKDVATAAVKFAQESPEPEIDELWDDVLED